MDGGGGGSRWCDKPAESDGSLSCGAGVAPLFAVEAECELVEGLASVIGQPQRHVHRVIVADCRVDNGIARNCCRGEEAEGLVGVTTTGGVLIKGANRTAASADAQALMMVRAVLARRAAGRQSVEQIPTWNADVVTGNGGCIVLPAVYVIYRRRSGA